MIPNFLKELEDSGLIHDISDKAGLSKLKSGDAFYVGFDPSAPSLQLGNLIPLIVVIRIARAGLAPIIIFGGATGAIGDPSGKSTERQLLGRATIDANITRQQKKTNEILNRVGITNVEFLNNFEWFKEMNVLEFLRDTGKHFTVNYMIAKEVIKTRLDGEGVSFTEFCYMLLQAYDFLHLYETKKCRLQIGGSDQWGNITAGLELIRKKGHADAFALSWPLITDRSGKKFGKTETGAIWLDESTTSSYKLHQFLINVDDADVIKYIKLLTFADKETIHQLEGSIKTTPEKREAQKFLADSVVTLVHGEEATKDANRSREVLFGGSIDGLSEKQLEEIFSDVPSKEISKNKLSSLNFTDLLVEIGAVKSKGEAKKLISGGGAYLNNERVSDGAVNIAVKSPLLVIRMGKKSYYLVKVV